MLCCLVFNVQLLFLKGATFYPSAKMVRSPEAEVALKWALVYKGADKPYLRVYLSNRRAHNVACPELPQANFCSDYSMRSQMTWQAKNVAFVYLDLPDQNAFFSQGEFYVGNQRIASINMTQDEITSKIRTMRYQHQGFYLLMVGLFVLLCFLIVALWKENRQEV